MRLTEILHCIQVPQAEIHKDKVTHLDVTNPEVLQQIKELRAYNKEVHQVKVVSKKDTKDPVREQGFFF